MSAEYTQYIVEHKANVEKAYRWLFSHNILDIHTARPTQIINHDLSKYQPEEYDAYDNYFYGTKTKEVKEAFDYAWLHHIHNNPHHWQYWVLVNDEDGTKALEMPEEYAIEMVCDWWAFSHKSGNLKEIFDWYKSHKKNMILHEKTKKFVEELLDKIKKVLEAEDNAE
jgi:hypothetical protein